MVNIKSRKSGSYLKCTLYVGAHSVTVTLECLRISSRTVFETEYDVVSNLFRIRKLCLRFLIYVMLENFRIDNQHGLCAEKC